MLPYKTKVLDLFTTSGVKDNLKLENDINNIINNMYNQNYIYLRSEVMQYDIPQTRNSQGMVTYRRTTKIILFFQYINIYNKQMKQEIPNVEI